MYLKKTKYLILLFGFIVLNSCATTKTDDFYNSLAPLIEQQNIGGAVDFASTFYEDCDKYNKFLYSIELGLLYHLNEDYRNSNKIFEEAKSTYSMKYYISTLFNNDHLLPSYYLGEDYEMAYINFFCSLNYLKVKNFRYKKNEAAVEARQLDNLFSKIKIDNSNEIYKDDPFLRYFMGLIYQNAKYYNDAMTSYKLALNAYKDYNICSLDVPKDLINCLYTLYCYYELEKESNDLLKEYPFAKTVDFNGNLIIINYNGIVPKKVEEIITMSFNSAWDKYYKTKEKYNRYSIVREFNVNEISVNFPVYQRYKNIIDSFIVEVTDINDSTKKYYCNSFLATDFATILEKNLGEPNYKQLFYSRINQYVRALQEIEYLRNNYRQKKLEIVNDKHLSSSIKNSLLQSLYKDTKEKIQDTKVGLTSLKKLNLKSWRSLPETINMAKLNLPKGKYNITIKYLDKNKNIVDTQELSTKIGNKRNKFIILKSYKEN